MMSSGDRLGFRLTLSLAHLGPEALAFLDQSPLLETLLGASPEARQHLSQTVPHANSILGEPQGLGHSRDHLASVADVAVSSSQRDGLRLVVEHTSPPEVLEVAAFLAERLRG